MDKAMNSNLKSKFAVDVPVKVKNLWSGSPFLDNWPDIVFEAELQEREEAYFIELMIPGVREEDLHVKAGYLYIDISAEKEEETRKSVGSGLAADTIYQAFNRRFFLPQIVDPTRIQARYSGGILKIFIPKPKVTDEMLRLNA